MILVPMTGEEFAYLEDGLLAAANQYEQTGYQDHADRMRLLCNRIFADDSTIINLAGLDAKWYTFAGNEEGEQ